MRRLRVLLRRGKGHGFSLREDRVETPLKYLRRGLVVEDEEIIILPLQSRRGKVRGTRA